MRGGQLGRVLLIAGLVNVLGLAANTATSFVTDRAQGSLRWILPPLIALGLALLTAVVQAAGTAPAKQEPQNQPIYAPPQRYPGPGGGAPGAPPWQQPRRTQWTPPHRRFTWGAALVLLLVLGVGAFALTAGVRYGVNYVTGNEAGEDRLVRPVAARSGALILRVDSVQDTSHFTRVGITVRNSGSGSVALPVFGNCVFVGGDGTTLEGDDFRSRWSTTVPPGTQQGTIVFGGTLPADATRASLSFSTVFGPGGGGSITVPIRLRAGPG